MQPLLFRKVPVHDGIHLATDVYHVGGGSLTRLGLGLSLNLQQAIELESNLCQTNRGRNRDHGPESLVGWLPKSRIYPASHRPPLGLRTAACNS